MEKILTKKKEILKAAMNAKMAFIAYKNKREGVYIDVSYRDIENIYNYIRYNQAHGCNLLKSYKYVKFYDLE